LLVLQVLHPLEVQDGDAARVREDVREDRDASLEEDAIGGRRRGPVRALDDELRADGARVVLAELALGGRGHEHVARGGEQFLVRRDARAG
jgi:hypothetical protein